jgi:ABC-2 type transport system permease protein
MPIAIALHEFRRFIRSPLPWFLFALVHFLEAMILFQMLSAYLEQQAVWQGFGITETVVAGTLRMAGMLLVLVTPFLTMRLCSDEQRHGTLSLLFTAPVRISQVVIGKFLGILLLLLCSLALTALLVVSLWFGTAPDAGQVGAGLLGLFLLLCAVAAIGLFCSTLTRQPAQAAAGAFAALFLLWILNLAGANAGPLAGIFFWLAIMPHFGNLLSGMLDTADIAYFLILTGGSLVLAGWRLDTLREYR